ncbi:MAG: winged helix-turn-helix transcriptional regulator [Candidatus Saganbacteria bacterium]|nr:winged helix-turn-helix transcriptional regulator [Candidatus Saganbacteria bacterium]
MVDDNEHKVIEEISRRQNLTQRELSARTNLSLGAVNIIIKRLVKRGVVKTTNLNSKKLEYALTPKGFSEKAAKSYNYILKTIGLVKKVKAEIAGIVLEEFNRGQRKFVVLGDDDLADIIELALKGFDYERINELKDLNDPKALVLVGIRGKKTNGFRSINIRERLGEAYWSVGLIPE